MLRDHRGGKKKRIPDTGTTPFPFLMMAVVDGVATMSVKYDRCIVINAFLLVLLVDRKSVSWVYECRAGRSSKRRRKTSPKLMIPMENKDASDFTCERELILLSFAQLSYCECENHRVLMGVGNNKS